MQTAPTSNGHVHLDRLIEDVRSEAEPAKAKRTRRTRAEMEASSSVKAADTVNTIKQPALVTLIIGGQEVTGTPGAIAAVMSALPARAAA